MTVFGEGLMRLPNSELKAGRAPLSLHRAPPELPGLPPEIIPMVMNLYRRPSVRRREPKIIAELNISVSICVILSLNAGGAVGAS